MYIEETTAEERNTIINALEGTIVNIDTAHHIIMDEIMDNFMSRKQTDIPAGKAEQIGRRLYAAAEMIFNSLIEYHLTVGEYEWRGVEPHLKGCERAQAAIRTEKAAERCWDIQAMPGMSEKAMEDIRAARLNLLSLPDEQAAPMLEALADKVTSTAP